MSAVVAMDGEANAEVGTKGEHFSPWTRDYLAFILPLTPEAILKPERGANGRYCEMRPRAEWRWIDLSQRLTFLYGPDEALKRLNRAAP